MPILGVGTDARSVSASEICLRALGRIGVTSRGEEPSAEDAQFAFDALNEMLSQWATQNMLVPSLQRLTFNTVAGQSTYTVGEDGDLNTTDIPITIGEGLTVRLSGVDWQVYPLNDGEFSQLQYKATQGRPDRFLYTTGVPGTIEFYPVPDTAYTVSIPVSKFLGYFEQYTQEVVLPAGYEAAISWSLAEYMMTDFGREIRNVIKMAKRSRDAIKRQRVDATFWAPVPWRPYNILTNQGG